MKNIADLLCEKTIQKRSPIVVGLDPTVSRIPDCYFSTEAKHPFEIVANAIVSFNKDVIDVVSDLVPAVKPQMAFYEKYGSYGVCAFEQTVMYAKSKGLIVIEDAKRNDIGNTARAYANGHLGLVELHNGELVPSYDVDFLTVTPYLGSESLNPFIETCVTYNKGVFVLARTSNPTGGEIQEAKLASGETVSESIGRFVATCAEKFKGEMGYSSIGAVVGATYPEEAAQLRRTMPHSIFLVPGYGAQGANEKDIVSSFNSDGLGAVVNSSRNILYAYEKHHSKQNCTRTDYMDSVKKATLEMQNSIYSALKQEYSTMLY